MSNYKYVNGVLYKKVYAKHVFRDGKYVYPKKKECLCFWVKA